MMPSFRMILSLPLILMLSADAVADEVAWSEKSPSVGAVKKMPSGLLSKQQLDELVQIGERLCSTKFTKPDGAGRPGATQAIIPTKARNKADLWLC